MPRIPQTFAKPGAVPGYAPARQIGDKMNIHLWDAMYEAGIREAGAIGEVGKQIGRGIEKFGAEIKQFVDTEKRKKDQIDIEQALNKYKVEHAKYLDNQMNNLTNPETGAVEFERYGQDMGSWKDSFLFETRESMNMSDEGYGVLSRKVEAMYANQEVSNIKTRANLRMQDTYNRYEDTIWEGVADSSPEAVATSIWAAKKQAEGNPKLLSELPAKIKEIKGRTWFNRQQKTIDGDFHNYKPMELSDKDIPDFYKDKAKVRLELEQYRKRIYAYKKAEFAKAELEYDNELYSKIGTDQFPPEKEILDKDGFDGKMYSVKEVKNLVAINNNMLLRKKEQTNKRILDATELTAYHLDMKNPDYESNKNEIMSYVKANFKNVDDIKSVVKIFADKEKVEKKIQTLPKEKKKILKDVYQYYNDKVALTAKEYSSKDFEYAGTKDIEEVNYRKVFSWATASLGPVLGSVNLIKNLMSGEQNVTRKEFDKLETIKELSSIQEQINEWAINEKDFSYDDAISKIDKLFAPLAKKQYKKEVLKDDELDSDVMMIDGIKVRIQQ